LGGLATGGVATGALAGASVAVQATAYVGLGLLGIASGAYGVSATLAAPDQLCAWANFGGTLLGGLVGFPLGVRTVMPWTARGMSPRQWALWVTRTWWGRPTAGPKTIDPATLPLPPGMTRNSQLSQLLDWPNVGPAGPGTGTHATQMARAQWLVVNLTSEKVMAIRTAGFTKEMAMTWAQFYAAEAVRVPQNINATARAFYLERLAGHL
jgi:hypothetical protein